jgi:hypothetical protein
MFSVRALQHTDHGTPLEVLPPVLFNTFKHHAGALRARIAAAAERGPAGLVEAGPRLVVLGSKLMDLYTGALTPHDISARILAQLQEARHLERPAFAAWLAAQQGYAVVTFTQDESRWVLRLGDEPQRYVHVHPGRWSPATVRVRANVLKTAFLALLHARIHDGDPMERQRINEVRRAFLGLSPVGDDPEEGLGLGAIIELLRREPER